MEDSLALAGRLQELLLDKRSSLTFWKMSILAFLTDTSLYCISAINIKMESEAGWLNTKKSKKGKVKSLLHKYYF